MSCHMDNVLCLALDLKQLRSKGPVLCSVCPWPAAWPWTGDFASLSPSFVKWGHQDLPLPFGRLSEKMLVRCPALCQAPGGWPRNSGCGHFSLCPSLWHRIVSPASLFPGLWVSRGGFYLGPKTLPHAEGHRKLVIGSQGLLPQMTLGSTATPACELS